MGNLFATGYNLRHGHTVTTLPFISEGVNKMSQPELEVENRRNIYRIIEKYPGLHMREIKRRVGLSMNLVRYHIYELKKYNLVSEVKKDGYKRYYPKRGRKVIEKKDKEIIGYLRKKIPLSVVIYLLNKGDATSHGEMAEELNISASTLSYHLEKMIEGDVLERKGRKYELVDPGHMMELLTHYKPPQDVIDEFIDLWDDLSL